MDKKYMVAAPHFCLKDDGADLVAFKIQNYLNMMHDDGWDLFKIMGNEFYIFKKMDACTPDRTGVR